MNVTGKILSATIDYKSGKPIMNIQVNEANNFKALMDELADKDKLSVEIKQYREKRSLNANAYCWKLLSEMADRLRTSKEEIYLQMLKRYGQREIISVMAHIPISEYVKYCEEAGESTLNGKLFKHYFVFKGSSEFDTREMSIFLDGVIDEAKEMGIQTETPNQIAEMKARWGE